MKNVDQELHAALVRIVRALDAAERSYCVIGALVPRLLMLVPPPQRTRDVDLVVEAASLEDVEALTRTLQANGYSLQDDDAHGLGEAARDAGRLPTDERWRTECHQLIEWYRLGAGV